jgi:hypothetical protein
MFTTGGQNMQAATLFIMQQIYIFIYVLVGFVSHNESSVYSHESHKTATIFAAT